MSASEDFEGQHLSFETDNVFIGDQKQRTVGFLSGIAFARLTEGMATRAEVEKALDESLVKMGVVDLTTKDRCSMLAFLFLGAKKET